MWVSLTAFAAFFIFLPGETAGYLNAAAGRSFWTTNPPPVAPSTGPRRRHTKGRHGSVGSESKLAALKTAQNEVKARVTPGIEPILWLAPWVVAGVAFNTFEPVSMYFHDFVQSINSVKWKQYQSFEANLILPALNGPLSTSLSIMFGTLVAITVSSLYSRQLAIQEAILDLVEQFKYLEILVQKFPTKYRKKVNAEVESTLLDAFAGIRQGGFTPKEIRARSSLPTLVNLLSELASNEDCPRTIDEAFGVVQNVLKGRARLLSTTSAVFPPWHYLTLLSIAMAISILFLIETDSAAQQYQAGFQLQLCWALLFWVFAMLGVLFYDLATPFSGIFRVISDDQDDIEQYLIGNIREQD